MSPSHSISKSFIDDLVAQRTGSDGVFSIPGFAQLSKAEQVAICARLVQIQDASALDAPAVDAAALQARLESLLSIPEARRSPQSQSPSAPSSTLATPPNPSEEEERQMYNQREEKCHKLLTEDGCPPCHPCDASCHPSNFSFHPSDDKFSAQEYPEQYREILAFFDTRSRWGEGPLEDQWVDWRQFRQDQRRVRHCDMQRFTKFTEGVRERRRRCNLPEDVCPRFQLQEQTRHENWVEFQDYHLRRDEELEKDVETESKGLDTATEKLRVATALDLELAERNRNTLTQRLDFAIKSLKRHQKCLLPWIERERIKMATAQSTAAEETNGTQKTSNPNACNGTPQTRSVLNPVPSAISERDSGKRSPRTQQPEPSATSAEPTSDFRTSPGNSRSLHNLSKKTDSEKIKSKSISLCSSSADAGQACQERERKSKQQSNIDTPPRLPPQSPKGNRRKPTPRGRSSPPSSRSVHQNLTEQYVTKRGRTSRRPQRPGFISY